MNIKFKQNVVAMNCSSPEYRQRNIESSVKFLTELSRQVYDFNDMCSDYERQKLQHSTTYKELKAISQVCQRNGLPVAYEDLNMPLLVVEPPLTTLFYSLRNQLEQPIGWQTTNTENIRNGLLSLSKHLGDDIHIAIEKKQYEWEKLLFIVKTIAQML